MASDATTWYCPVEDMAIFRAFVKPDLANVQDVGAYDPCENPTCVDVVDKPRAMLVDINWMSFVVRSVVEREDAERDDTTAVDAVNELPTRDDAAMVDAENDPVDIEEPDSVEKVISALDWIVDAVRDDAVI